MGHRVATGFSRRYTEHSSLSNPAWRGRKILLAPRVRVPLHEQTGHSRGCLWEFFISACFETTRQKQLIKICLPPSQIYLFPFDKQWFHFSSRPGFFFSFSFKVSPSQRGKKLFARVLICQTRHRRTLTTILGTSPCLHWLTSAEGELPNTTLPQPQCTLLKRNISFFFKSNTVNEKRV